MRRVIKVSIFLLCFSLGFLAVAYASEEAIASSAQQPELEVKMPESNTLLEAVSRRSERLAALELANRVREEHLTSLRSEVDRKLESLETTIVRLEKILLEMKKRDESKVTALAKVYENMPPEEAAARIERIERELAVKLLKSMQSRKSGKVLGYVSPQLAARLSEDFGKSIIPTEGN